MLFSFKMGDIIVEIFIETWFMAMETYVYQIMIFYYVIGGKAKLMANFINFLKVKKNGFA